MYNFLIDPNKWVNVGEIELELNSPYWFKKTNGQIVLGVPFSNGASMGIADCCLDAGILNIIPNVFHIVKGGQVQPLLNN